MGSIVEAALSTPARSATANFPVLGTLSAAHLVNDMMQSLLLAIYPLLKNEFKLTFTQLGVISLIYQFTASLPQPWIGFYADRHPLPRLLPVSMAFTTLGLLTLAYSHTYSAILVAAALVGCGSSIFHPESSRIARVASGARHGLAQCIFQIGGNAGGALGPLLTALIILPNGRPTVAWFGFVTLLGIGLLWRVAMWHHTQQGIEPPGRHRTDGEHLHLPTGTVAWSLLVLMILVFSKYFYLESIDSYYVFFLMAKFHASTRVAQLHLFVFFFAVAAGTILGGPIGDRIGRKRVIWVSILGAAPFTLVLPYVDLPWTCALTCVIGLILASAFSAIVVYAQELLPHRVGMVSGLFFGLAFGFGGIGAAILGSVTDHYGIEFMYRLCAYLPLLGVVTAFLPGTRR